MTLDEALASAGNAADLRLVALTAHEIARIDGIMTAITKEPQTATWSAALSSLCSFIRMPGRGIRSTYAFRSVDAKLVGSAARIFGTDFTVKIASAFDRMFYVDLNNVPPDLDDGDMYDFISKIELIPLITPAFPVEALMSGDRMMRFLSSTCAPSW
ncbi:hypothetical protein GN244_ATG01039 [Phytophthora infestans]|uniref:Uncharacterized protein n=1 Tax=Phytophthora infestans TaxID=4787 RepID=A0A833T4E4_PHYIN|nr:hypothetical protein GN244_ATG01039 [Phytophthora infestans]